MTHGPLTREQIRRLVAEGRERGRREAERERQLTNQPPKERYR